MAMGDSVFWSHRGRKVSGGGEGEGERLPAAPALWGYRAPGSPSRLEVGCVCVSVCPSVCGVGSGGGQT